jgi:hypothetical protein
MYVIHSLDFKFFSPIPGRSAQGYRVIGRLKFKGGIFTFKGEFFADIGMTEGGVWEMALAEDIAKDLGVPLDLVKKTREIELCPGDIVIVPEGGMGLPISYYAVEVI